MYGVDMHYTIKTLLKQGKSIRSIAAALGIHRNTVRRIADQLAASDGAVKTPTFGPRPSKLDSYGGQIERWIKEEGLSPGHIHQRLKEQSVQVSYSGVRRYVRSHFPASGEVYIPVHSDPGSEGQVDFGYLGYFEKDGKKVK